MRYSDPARPDVIIWPVPAEEVVGADQIVVTRTPGRVEITKAPKNAKIDLALVAAAGCGHEIAVSGDRITLAEQVVYRVVGWDPEGALVVERVEDRRRRG